MVDLSVQERAVYEEWVAARRQNDSFGVGTDSNHGGAGLSAILGALYLAGLVERTDHPGYTWWQAKAVTHE